jgi:hypothetical protein
MDAAYTNYLECCNKETTSTAKIGSGKKRASSTFHIWRDQFKWDERVAKHDREFAEKAIARQIEKQAEEYQAKIDKYVQQCRQLSEQSMAICLAAKGELIKFMQTKPEISSWRDASTAARLVGLLETAAVELGGKALHIQPLLEASQQPTD